MRVYIRIDPELVEKKSTYPDGALVAFISAICAAEQQPNRGRFKTVKILKAYLGTRARWIPFLITHHDLVELENGVLYVDGWDEWQEGDWKVNERVQRIRNRQKVTPPVTVPVTPDVTVPVTPPRRPLTLPDSPSEPLAVSRKPLATSEHGDLVHESPDQANGTGSLSTQAVHLVGWLLVNRSDHTFSTKAEQERELSTATAMLQLGLPYPEVLAKLQGKRNDMDPDDVASSLSFYYGWLQDEVHAQLKAPRDHARSGTLSKAGSSLPAIQRGKP